MPGPLDALLRYRPDPNRPVQWTPESEQTSHPVGDTILGVSDALLGASGLPRNTTGGKIGSMLGASLPALGLMKGFGAARGGSAVMEAPEAIQDLSRATPDLIHSMPTPQAMPSGEDVGALEGLMNYNLAKVPQGRPRVPEMESVPQANPAQSVMDFMNPRGFEAMESLRKSTPPVYAEMNAKGMFNRRPTGPVTQAEIDAVYNAPQTPLGETHPEFTPMGGEDALNAQRVPSGYKPTDPDDMIYQVMMKRGRRE